MQPARINLTWWQNADFNVSLAFTDQNGNPHDFTGSTFEMDVKVTGNGPVAVAVTIEASQIDEGIVGLGFADGALGVGEYVYDLIRIDGGARELMVYGTFSMLQGVTQP